MPAVELSDLHVALFNAWQAEDYRRARDLYIRSLPMLLVQQIFRMRLTKRVLMLRGLIDTDFCRAPLPEFDAIGLSELAMMLDELAPDLSWTQAK